MITHGLPTGQLLRVVAGRTVDQAADSIPSLGRSTFLQVNQFARDTGWLHTPMALYAEYGVVLFAALMLLGWWLARRSGSPTRMAAALWTPVGMLLAVAVAQPIGSAVAERRPFVELPHILVLVQHSRDYGFPSDHATMAGAVAAGAFLVNRRLGIVSTLAALLIAFARVYVAVHYPQDVLGGLVLGAAVLLLGYLVVSVPLTALVRRLTTTPLRPLLCATGATGPVPDHRSVPTDEATSQSTMDSQDSS